MGAQTVMTHAPSRVGGVSLAKAGDPVSVPVVPVTGTTMIDIGESDWWGVPAYMVRGWVTVRLRRGEYAQASWLSGRLHSA